MLDSRRNGLGLTYVTGALVKVGQLISIGIDLETGLPDVNK